MESKISLADIVRPIHKIKRKSLQSMADGQTDTNQPNPPQRVIRSILNQLSQHLWQSSLSIDRSPFRYSGVMSRRLETREGRSMALEMHETALVEVEERFEQSCFFFLGDESDRDCTAIREGGKGIGTAAERSRAEQRSEYQGT